MIDFLSALRAGHEFEPGFIARYERTIVEIERDLAGTTKDPNNGVPGSPLIALGIRTALPVAARDTGAFTKPCCRRVRFPSGATGWCGSADGHHGDCVPLGVGEIEPGDYGPKAATNTRRGKQ